MESEGGRGRPESPRSDAGVFTRPTGDGPTSESFRKAGDRSKARNRSELAVISNWMLA